MNYYHLVNFLRCWLQTQINELDKHKLATRVSLFLATTLSPFPASLKHHSWKPPSLLSRKCSKQTFGELVLCSHGCVSVCVHASSHISK